MFFTFSKCVIRWKPVDTKHVNVRRLSSFTLSKLSFIYTSSLKNKLSGDLTTRTSSLYSIVLYTIYLVMILYYIITIYVEDYFKEHYENITLLPIRSPNSATMASSLTSPHLAVSIVELPWSPQTFDENLRFFRFILSVGWLKSESCPTGVKAVMNQDNGLLKVKGVQIQLLTQYKNIKSLFRLTWTNCMRTDLGCCNCRL